MQQAPDQYSVNWNVWQEKDLDNKTGNTALWKKETWIIYRPILWSQWLKISTGDLENET